MPLNCICRLLLLVSLLVWEDLAKSVPDQGSFGKTAVQGMQHNEMGVVAFLRLLSTSRRCLQRCAFISARMDVDRLKRRAWQAFLRDKLFFGSFWSLISLSWNGRGHGGAGGEVVLKYCRNVMWTQACSSRSGLLAFMRVIVAFISADSETWKIWAPAEVSPSHQQDLLWISWIQEPILVQKSAVILFHSEAATASVSLFMFAVHCEGHYVITLGYACLQPFEMHGWSQTRGTQPHLLMHTLHLHFITLSFKCTAQKRKCCSL